MTGIRVGSVEQDHAKDMEQLTSSSSGATAGDPGPPSPITLSNGNGFCHPPIPSPNFHIFFPPMTCKWKPLLIMCSAKSSVVSNGESADETGDCADDEERRRGDRRRWREVTSGEGARKVEGRSECAEEVTAEEIWPTRAETDATCWTTAFGGNATSPYHPERSCSDWSLDNTPEEAPYCTSSSEDPPEMALPTTASELLACVSFNLRASISACWAAVFAASAWRFLVMPWEKTSV